MVERCYNLMFIYIYNFLRIRSNKWFLPTEYSLQLEPLPQKLYVEQKISSIFCGPQKEDTSPHKKTQKIRARERQGMERGDKETFSKSNKKQTSPNPPFPWKGTKFPCAYGLAPSPVSRFPTCSPCHYSDRKAYIRDVRHTDTSWMNSYLWW